MQQPPAPVPAPQPYRGPLLFGLTLALIGIALGSLGLYDVAEGGVADAAYPALALAVVGVMLVVGAWFGRPGGLILLGVLASIGLLATSVADPRVIGDQSIVETPTRAVQVEDLYTFTAGATHLDLSNIRDVARLDGRTVAIEGNAGQIVVTLPENLDVDVTATVAMAGEVQVLEERHGGTGVSMTRTVDGGDGAAQLDLDLLPVVVGEDAEGAVAPREPHRRAVGAQRADVSLVALAPDDAAGDPVLAVVLGDLLSLAAVPVGLQRGVVVLEERCSVGLQVSPVGSNEGVECASFGHRASSSSRAMNTAASPRVSGRSGQNIAGSVEQPAVRPARRICSMKAA